ncbi:MAG TPA: T9SS type A sorting domain-containing protein [Ignavibacteria bacterium]|nr:hypothetical protein [Bacteroidota bacterium]HRE10330.1 T9SS type A sorting domain-containing protein [Ignavibacteria bacterium]HRF67049.1 T9SS type A sorting domain-containing protein [Ignavibacteria bacterium]HRJ04059.1 T9SS type A sorting domain-containing protein [Ignavibacteria bacterium]
MKTFKLFLTLKLILLSFLFLDNIKAQSENFSDFLPLQTGNIWVYQCTTNGSMCGGCSGKVRVKLTGDTIVNGKTYKRSQSLSSTISGACQSCGNASMLPLSNVRVDLINGNVYQQSQSGCSYSPGEMMIDSLKARLHDTVRMNCQPPLPMMTYICTDTNNATVLGTSRQTRFYNNAGFEGGYYRKYAMGIGLYHIWSQGLDGGTFVCTRQMILLGCVINGITYGDTSMLVGIQQLSSEIPEQFSLSQNYPNPFNPVTNIQFTLPKSAFVKITIYDALGKETETLVQQELNAGSYETQWSAVNYPSGVYYYSISAGEYTETKKMVLIK